MESLILLPITTMSTLPVGPITQATINVISSPRIVLSQKLNNSNDIFAINNGEEAEAAILEAKAKAIDAYFEARDMPLLGMGMKMVEEAEKNGLDWRLIPAIAVRESTGGKFACKTETYNSFGWGSCKIGFDSNEHAIEIVAKNLGGNNPKTASYYDNKTTLQILQAYNPPSIIPRYAQQVIAIMDAIGKENSEIILDASVSSCDLSAQIM